MNRSPLRIFLYHGSVRYVHGLRHQVEALGHVLVGEGQGDPTQAALQAPPCRPDVVVVMLSGGPGEGVDFATTLRLETETADAPVIFIGGTREEADRAQKVLPRAVLAEEPTLRKALEVCHPRASTQAVLEENTWVAMHDRDLRRDRDDRRALPPWLSARH